MNNFSSKSKLLRSLGIVLLVGVLNTPAADQLGNRTSLFLNGVILAVFVAWGSYRARVADETQTTFALAGFVRTRRLLFIAYGGYFLGATVGVFGGTMLMLGNPRVPKPLEMPDASILAIYCMGLLLWLLIDVQPTYRRTGRSGLSIGLLFLLVTGALEVGGVVTSQDVFKPLSSLFALSIWIFISNESVGDTRTHFSPRFI